MSTVKFAFVGPTRHVSPWLLRALSQVGTLEAICDDQADREVARYHARWTFSDVAVMLREAEPDGVVLHYPLHDRASLIKTCLSAGCDVLLTGVPGAVSNCKRWLSLGRLTGKHVVAVPPVRFSPVVIQARRLLASGKMGAPVSLLLSSTWQRSQRLDPTEDTVVSVDQIFEAVSLVHHLIGPINQACSYTHTEGVLAVAANAGSGVPVLLRLHSSGTPETVGLDLEIRSADGGELSIDRDGRLSCGNGQGSDVSHRVSVAVMEPSVELGYDGLVAEFRRNILAEHFSPSLVVAAWEATAATEAVLAGLTRNRPQSPKYPDSQELNA